MTIRNLPRQLTDITSTVISSHLWTFVTEHIDTKCKYCCCPVPIPKCTLVADMRSQVSDLPYDAFRLVQTKLDKSLQSHWHSLTSPANRNRMTYLLTSLYENGNYMEIKDYTLNQYEDIYFLKKFGKYIRNINFELDNPIQAEDIATWALILTLIPNVIVIDMRSIFISGNILGTIGRCCFQVKMLAHVNLTESVTNQDFLKLCYSDYDTNRNNKNRCCTTLQVVELFRRQSIFAGGLNLFRRFGAHGYFIRQMGDTITQNNVYNTLITNLPNLKYLGSEFLVEKYLSEYAATTVPEINLREVTSHDFTVDTAKAFCTMFAKCRKVNMQLRQPPVVFESLSQMRNLIILHCTSNLVLTGDVISQGLLQPIWTNVQQLILQTQIDRVHLSLFSSHFPMLKGLEVNECNTVDWNRKSFFKKLEKIKFGSIFDHNAAMNLEWLSSFSYTIQHIYLGFTELMITGESASVLATLHFPHLEHLNIYPLRFNIYFLIGILDMCPALRRIGVLIPSEEDGFEELVDFQSQMMQQNFNITFIT